MANRKRVGSWVRLRKRVRNGPQKARIHSEHPGFARGAVYLDRPLDGLRWWNKSDLELTTPPKARVRRFTVKDINAINARARRWEKSLG